MEDCKTIQKMIVPFEMDKLSLKEEEMFIHHLENCEDCKEEFEIHYIISYGLSDDEEALNIQPQYRQLLTSYDFKGLVDLKIRNSEKKIERIRRWKEAMNLCWIGSNFCLVAVLLVYFIVRYY